MPLKVRGHSFGFVYLEADECLRVIDGELIHVMANQCAAALHNFFLHRSLEESYEHAIDMLAEVAEFKDGDTGSHVRRIEEYTRRLALELGFDAATAAAYAHASCLHDVGKVGIPDEILKKSGPLTEEEFAVIKTHPHIGDTLMRRNPSWALARSVALSHHERWSGAGYPHGLKGESIPIEARIVAVVDVFDALISARPYKEAWEPEKAVEHVTNESGVHFDPHIVDAFLRLYQNGSLADLVARARVESANRG